MRTHLPHHITTTSKAGNSPKLEISYFSRSLNLKHLGGKGKKGVGEGEGRGNVVIAHLREGMEVLHLFSGRTLCYVPFSPGISLSLSPFLFLSLSLLT